MKKILRRGLIQGLTYIEVHSHHSNRICIKFHPITMQDKSKARDTFVIFFSKTTVHTVQINRSKT